ncbi:MAG TPA: HAMP domain-containing histidine kinase [Planctomycetes bacterium]|nr:HAMP domain-containing histidine kinase [Planctomycetota bacterium]
MKPSRSRIASLLGIVMVSAGGLLAFGLLSLRRTAEDARASALMEARAAAEALAGQLRQALKDPAILEQAGPEEVFAWDAEGRLVLPPEVGWLRAPPPEPDILLSRTARRALRQAEDREFIEGDRPAALQGLVAAVEAVSSPDERSFLLLRAAWCAERGGLTKERDRLLDRIPTETLTEPTLHRSALLLQALRRQRLPESAVVDLPRWPPDTAHAFLARMAAHGVGGLEPLRQQIEDVQGRRRRLRAADDVLRSGAADGAPALASREGFLVLLFPKREGGGRGAVGSPEEAIRWAGLDPQRFRIGDDASSSGGVPAAPLIAVLPRRGNASSPWTDSRWVSLLLLVLAGSFCLGLIFTLRAVRRETEAARVRSEFLTGVTHELKTPLASIRLLAEMLEEGRVPDDARRATYHRLLSGESARLGMLIENVLDLGRMERGERAYTLRTQAVEPAIQEAADLFRPLAERDGLRLDVALADPEFKAVLDRSALVQALLNVLENARKYALEGGNLEIRGRAEKDIYTVLVRDFGPGIPSDERESVFERFRRGAAHQDGSISGVGLGLHLARRLVRDLGGDLRAVAPPDEKGGACFVMTLPRSETHDS